MTWGFRPFWVKKTDEGIKEEEVQGSLALKPIEIPKLPEKLPVLSLTLDAFSGLAELVIKYIEGGYYHPSMKHRFSAASRKKLGDSGETLFGLDRKHGAQLAMYEEWDQFWSLVDKGKKLKPGLFTYNEKDVPYAGELRRLASAIMYKWFNYLAGKYILVSSMDEIAADPRLILHFAYASWNGEGWFERYSKALNTAVQMYEGDKEQIWQEAIKARTQSSNSVIRQQGKNMMYIINKHKL